MIKSHLGVRDASGEKRDDLAPGPGASPLRVWLAGSRTFGVEVFGRLQELPGVSVVGITTSKRDDPLALAAGRNVFCDQGFESLKDQVVDLLVSAHNFVYIGAETRAAARHGAIGYHPSLLPRHRGRRAVEATVERGDPIAGGTVYLMDDGWDTGPIIAQGFCHVLPGWTASDLWREELFPLGLRLLTKTVWELSRCHSWITKAQDERAATSC